jgi:hypothetical protein
MGSRKAPAIVQALPEPHLRGLRDTYALQDLLAASSCCEEYSAIASDAARSLEQAYGYEPTPWQLRNVLAAVICDRSDFLEYLGRNGGVSVLDSESRLAEVALAAAGTLVARYLVEQSDG